MTDFLRIDTQGAIAALQAEFSALPAGIARARKRALAKLMTWVKRQLLKEVSAATGVPQKVFSAIMRYSATTLPDGSITIWIGTNPIRVHNLGKVTWQRSMSGARVGPTTYAGSWSRPGSKTGPLVMRRTGPARDAPIAPETQEIHPAAARRLDELQPAIGERFIELMRQELNYAINVEGARAA
jgi:hypothetical protein